MSDDSFARLASMQQTNVGNNEHEIMNTILGCKIARRQPNVHNERILYKICLKMIVWEIINICELTNCFANKRLK